MTYNERCQEFVDYYKMTDDEKVSNNTKYQEIKVSIRYIGSGMMSYTMMGSGFDNGQHIALFETKRFNRNALQKIAAKANGQKIGKMFASKDIEGMHKAIEELRHV